MIPWLLQGDEFPPVSQALGAMSDAPGLLAASESIDADWLLRAYRVGVFPWYSDGQPVLWWSPDPRMVLQPAHFKLSDSLRKTLRRVLRDPRWQIRVDVDFAEVMQSCARIFRSGQDGTWITADIVAAYSGLHARGLAHSVESWYEGERVGGLYGVVQGKMFFGESMFARRTDASKIALAALVSQAMAAGVEMIDCQQNTPHLASLGGREIPRDRFISHLRRVIDDPLPNWVFDKTVLEGLL